MWTTSSSKMKRPASASAEPIETALMGGFCVLFKRTAGRFCPAVPHIRFYSALFSQ